jgi:hypothetical protein
MKLNTYGSKKLLLTAIFFFFFQANTWGDQYLTDTPQTMDYGQVEADIYSDLTKTKKNYAIRTPAFETNIGVMTDFQIRFNMPATLAIAPHEKTNYGYGDGDIGFKCRFIHETDVLPQVAFYPKITLPLGDPLLRLGNGGGLERLPIWLQKSWGKWILSGGGGYGLNHAPRGFNYPYGGILLRRVFNPSLTLGGEFLAQGPKNLADHSTLFFNFGGTYNFTPNVFILFSAAHSFSGMKTLKGFMGLGMIWGP